MSGTALHGASSAATGERGARVLAGLAAFRAWLFLGMLIVFFEVWPTIPTWAATCFPAAS